MSDDAGRPQVGYGTVRNVAGTLRRAAREQDGVVRQRAAQDIEEERSVIGDNAEGDRLASQLAYGVGEDRAVAVVNQSGPHRGAGRDQLVAGREDRDARPAHHGDLGEPQCRQHAGFARGQLLAAAQDDLASTNVRAGEGHVIARRHRPAQHQLAIANVGMLNHDDGVGPARQHGPGGDSGRGAGGDGVARRPASRQRLGVQPQRPRPVLARPERVGRLHREPVHVGAVEARHVERGGHVFGQYAPQRRQQRHRLRVQRPQVERRAEAALRLVAVDHVQELLLPERLVHDGSS